MVGSQERDSEEVTPNSILKLKRPCHVEGEVEESVRGDFQKRKEYVREEKKRRKGGRMKKQKKIFSKEGKKYKEI